GLDGLAAFRNEPDDATGEVRLDLVEQLHRLDEADDLADRHFPALADVRRRAWRRRGVEDAGQWRLDAGPRGRCFGGDASRVGGGLFSCGGGRRDRGNRDRLPQDERRSARLDLQLAEVAAIEDRGEAVDERQQRRITL